MLNFFENKFVPIASKIGNQRHLIAIRDTFIGCLPLTIIGSFCVLLDNISQNKGFGWFEKFMNSIFGETSWHVFFNQAIWATYGIIALMIVAGLPYKLAKSYGDDGFEAIFVSLASFFVLIPTDLTELIKDFTVPTYPDYFWAGALFIGIFVAIISTEIFVRLQRFKKLEIKMPEGVPPAVIRSFQKMFPAIISFLLMTLIGTIFILHGTDLITLLNEVLVKPFTNATDSLPGVFIIVFIINFFWIFGLHGDNIMDGVVAPLGLTMITENIRLYSDHVTDLSKYHVFSEGFITVFIEQGGTGMTITLLLALLLFSKTRRQMVNVGLGPGLFNINEPIIFGMPIVLNPTWMIPFLVGPMICVVVDYLAISMHFVHPIVAQVPWTTPPILGGYLATGGHISGAVLCIVNLVICFICYLPFVFMANRVDKKFAKENSSISA